MAYKPKNIARLGPVSNEDSRHPLGVASNGGGFSGLVPGTSYSEDRESQGADVEFKDQGQVRRPNPDFSIMNGGNDELDPRKNPNHGQASYNYEKPTL